LDYPYLLEGRLLLLLAKTRLDQLFLKPEIFRFLLVGAVNFVFTFLVFTLALQVFHLGYALALLLAWITGNVFTYILNFLWVFRLEEKLNFKGRFLKYLTAGAASISVNLVVLSMLVEIGKFDPFWSQFFVTPFIILFNFVTAKFWSLSRREMRR
jgi:putative flippase GtrA